LWSVSGTSVDAEALAEAVAHPSPNAILKQARRRLVLRVTGSRGLTVVLKAFPLDVLARPGYRKYALQELANYSAARQRNVPTPEPLAYIEQRRFGLVSLTGLVLEDLCGWRSFMELAAVDRASLRPLVTDLFRRLFESGANHIDTNPDNLLFSPDKSSVRLIDWQYASFPAPRRVEQLVLQVGRFLTYSDIWSHQAEREAWLDAFYSTCQPDVTANHFWRMVAAAAEVKQPYRSRLKLAIKGL
jgi:hypothetical protein